VDLGDTPVIPDEMEIPQIHDEEVAREEPPVQVGPHTEGPTRIGRVTSHSNPQYSWNVANVLELLRVICKTSGVTWLTYIV